MKFIDLFAGLGGFHVALNTLGHECVFACEKDPRLRNLYTTNFNLECSGDIRTTNESDIPTHDILCAGFPCQPFSKAGKQKGFDDVGRGDLFHDIIRILNHHKPQFFILENVPNIKKHDRERTWNYVEKSLRMLGYDVKEEILSPHHFGVPQIRNRIFIVGSLGTGSLKDFAFPKPILNKKIDIREILSENPPEAKMLSEKQIECLNIWQEIISMIPKEDALPSFPIWGMEFGADYPIDKIAPYKMTSEELNKYKGAFGKSLAGLSKDEQIAALPSYARYDEAEFPKWKKKFLTDIRGFFKKNEQTLSSLINQLQSFPPSWQKLEWNCLDLERNIFSYIIQFRASGIRIKRTNYSPALVLTSTQIPIIGWERRYITLNEAAKLQQLENIVLPDVQTFAYRSLGNAVNVKTVTNISQELLQELFIPEVRTAMAV